MTHQIVVVAIQFVQEHVAIKMGILDVLIQILIITIVEHAGIFVLQSNHAAMVYVKLVVVIDVRKVLNAVIWFAVLLVNNVVMEFAYLILILTITIVGHVEINVYFQNNVVMAIV